MEPIENLCVLPNCRAVLEARHAEQFDTWVCPNGHGIAVSLSELWGHVQDDDIHALWQLVKGAPTNDRKSPALGLPMSTVVVTIDSDEIEGNVGPDSKTLTLDVSDAEEMVWFDTGELEAFAPDIPNAEPSADELAKVHQIGSQFAAGWIEASKSHQSWVVKASDKLVGKIDPNGKLSGAFSKK